MILFCMQCSLSKDHQHLSRLPGCSGPAAEMQYPHTPRSQWNLKENVQIFGIRLPKHCWSKVGKQVPSGGNVNLHTEKNDFACLCMWTISQIGRQYRKHRTDLWEFSWKTLILENHNYFLTMHLWVAISESVKSARMLWRTTEICSYPGFLLEPKKTTNQSCRENRCRLNIFWVFLTWKVTRRNVERHCDFSNKKTQQ